jgi:FkbM family methyltransferase
MSLAGISKRLFGSIMRRIPVGSRIKRELLEVALFELQEVAYARLRDQGFSPNGIIDVGAHKGDWIRSVRQIFPDPPALSVEAREEQRASLSLACSELSGVQFAIALLGSEPRSAVEFQVHGTGSSMFAERSDASRTTRQMQMRTLDDVVSADGRLKPPIFLKLDIQGAELEVLRGAEKTLSLSEIVQIEVALLKYNEGAPLSAEVVAFMDAKGFAVYDIAGFIRPTGTDLVQIDILFARKTSRLRRDFFQFQS